MSTDIGPFQRGDSIKFNVTVTLNGAALDISAYSIWCTGKRQLSDTDVQAVFQVTKTAGDIVVGGTGNNIAQVTIPPSGTASLTDNINLFYDVQIKSVAGVIDTVANGRMQIVLDVTQAT